MNRNVSYSIYIILFFAICINCYAQDFELRGKFIEDSTQVGEEIRYTLAARYPANFTVLFPDSTSSFHPFEFIRKSYTPTKTVDNVSYDSVVYTLMTFEVDGIQSLGLPLYVVHQSDCTQYNSPRDTIFLSSVIADLPDSVSLNSLPLKDTAAFEPLQYQFNYGNALIIGGFLAIMALSVWILFGKKIRRHFMIRRLQQNHIRFIQDYTGSLENMKRTVSSLTAETAVSVWKKYMERLEATPFTKLTTKETIRLLKDDSLSQPLHSIDRAIYGNHDVNEQPFEQLKTYAEEKFQKKLEEVKHG